MNFEAEKDLVLCFVFNGGGKHTFEHVCMCRCSWVLNTGLFIMLCKDSAIELYTPTGFLLSVQLCVIFNLLYTSSGGKNACGSLHM